MAATASGPIDAEWLASEDLEAHCRILRERPQDIQNSVCAAYLQGMLSVATPTAVQGPDASAEAESAATRAARRRVGSRLRWLADNQYARYCISDVPFDDVLEAIFGHFEQRSLELDVTVHSVVLDALSQRFPCT